MSALFLCVGQCQDHRGFRAVTVSAAVFYLCLFGNRLPSIPLVYSFLFVSPTVKSCTAFWIFNTITSNIDWFNLYAFRWMGHAVEMFSIPGHSAGSCCIVVDDLLFVGDTVLENNLMVKFPGSSKKLYRSVTAPLLEKWLMGNRVSCVYPGHGDVMSPEMALGLIRDI